MTLIFLTIFPNACASLKNQSPLKKIFDSNGGTINLGSFYSLADIVNIY